MLGVCSKGGAEKVWKLPSDRRYERGRTTLRPKNRVVEHGRADCVRHKRWHANLTYSTDARYKRQHVDSVNAAKAGGTPSQQHAQPWNEQLDSLIARTAAQTLIHRARFIR